MLLVRVVGACEVGEELLGRGVLLLLLLLLGEESSGVVAGGDGGVYCVLRGHVDVHLLLRLQSSGMVLLRLAVVSL